MAPNNLPPSPLVPNLDTTAAANNQPLIVGLAMSAVYSTVAVIGLGVAWGLLAFFTNSIFLYGAVAIGALVSLAATSAFQRVNWLVLILMFVPCIVLSLVTVLWGDYIFYVLSAVRDSHWTFPRAVTQVALNFVEIEFGAGSDGIKSVLFGGIGAVLGFFGAMRRG